MGISGTPGTWASKAYACRGLTRGCKMGQLPFEPEKKPYLGGWVVGWRAPMWHDAQSTYENPSILWDLCECVTFHIPWRSATVTCLPGWLRSSCTTSCLHADSSLMRIAHISRQSGDPVLLCCQELLRTCFTCGSSTPCTPSIPIARLTNSFIVRALLVGQQYTRRYSCVGHADWTDCIALPAIVAQQNVGVKTDVKVKKLLIGIA